MKSCKIMGSRHYKSAVERTIKCDTNMDADFVLRKLKSHLPLETPLHRYNDGEGETIDHFVIVISNEETSEKYGFEFDEFDDMLSNYLYCKIHNMCDEGEMLPNRKQLTPIEVDEE